MDDRKGKVRLLSSEGRGRDTRTSETEELSRPWARPGHSVPRTYKIGWWKKIKINETNRCGYRGAAVRAESTHKKKTGYRIKAILDGSEACNFYPEANYLGGDIFGSNGIIYVFQRRVCGPKIACLYRARKFNLRSSYNAPIKSCCVTSIFW